jgi:hypothetical protein
MSTRRHVWLHDADGVQALRLAIASMAQKFDDTAGKGMRFRWRCSGTGSHGLSYMHVSPSATTCAIQLLEAPELGDISGDRRRRIRLA